jgi:hypothetical protein
MNFVVKTSFFFLQRMSRMRVQRTTAVNNHKTKS